MMNLISRLRSTLKRWLNPIRGAALVLGSLGMVVAIFGSLYRGSFASELIDAFYANVGAELVSIAITVIVIDALYERRETTREKQRLLRQMSSRNNGLAVHAVDELRAHKWLTDGSTVGIVLQWADLRGAYLLRANLKRARMWRANLAGASLRYASLQGDDLRKVNMDGTFLWFSDLRDTRSLTDRQLAQAFTLRKARMPDGSLYDGRFRLAGDLEDVQRSGRSVQNAEHMADWYGIEVDIYLNGQGWADMHLERLKQDIEGGEDDLPSHESNRPE